MTDSRRIAPRLGLLGLALLSFVFACRQESADGDAQTDQHIMSFDSTRLRIVSTRDTVRLSVELATTPAQRTMGLMERHHLAENAGMLFVYDTSQPPDAGFWMFRTRIPLDIAFMDSSGVVRSIREMVPCEATLAQGCPTYTPDVPYRYALEVNSGYFKRHGIAVGSAAFKSDLPATGR